MNQDQLLAPLGWGARHYPRLVVPMGNTEFLPCMPFCPQFFIAESFPL